MPITVNSEIKRLLKEKEAGIRSGVDAVRGVLKDLHRQVMADLGRAAVGSWDEYHLRQLLDAVENAFASWQPAAGRALAGGLDAAWKAGVSLVDAPLAVGGIFTGFHLSTSSLDALKDYGNDYLRHALGDAWLKVKGEINLGILGGKSPAEVAKAIGRSIDSGRFASTAYRAETITKLEMGRVFSTATDKRMDQAAKKVEGLEKMWQHRGHPREPRPSHLAAHGQHVPVNKSFNVGGISMRFPRDPNAPLGETINCGCDHVPYHARWAA